MPGRPCARRASAQAPGLYAGGRGLPVGTFAAPPEILGLCGLGAVTGIHVGVTIARAIVTGPRIRGRHFAGPRVPGAKVAAIRILHEGVTAGI